MTIAAGIISRDGVTIAADTHESYGEDHTYVDKISIAIGDTGQGAIASSGDGDLLDYITPQIQNLIANGSWTTLDQFEIHLRQLMAVLYSSDSISAYPKDDASGLHTKFLVAVRHMKGIEAKLFIVSSSLVTPATQIGTVIGCGTLREFVEEIGNVTGYTLAKAKIAAIAAVHEAKRRHSFVSGKISVCTVLNAGSYDNESESKTVAIETILDDVRQITNRITLSTLDSSISPNKFNSMLKETHAHLRDIRRAINQVEAGERREGRIRANRAKKKWNKLVRERRARLSTSQKSEPEQ